MVNNTSGMSGRARGIRWVGRVAVGLVFPALLVCIWQFSVQSGWWPRQIVAAPMDVLDRAIFRLGNLTIWVHSVASLKRLFSGFLLGGILGTVLGFATGVVSPIERMLSPTIRVLSPIPPIAWIPLLVVVMGIGEGSKIGLLTIGTFFVLYLSSFQSVRNTDQRLVDVARALEKTTWETTWTIFVPAALPPVLVGARTALALSWILLIAAEVIASADGLGWFIWDSRNFSRPADMLVGMAAVGALGGVTDWLVVKLTRPYLAWRTDYQGER